jgi:hypothetical protein
MTDGPPLLRQELDTLTALISRASEHLKIDPAFVEKDFWVTELLRSVATGDAIMVDGHPEPVAVVFKGGTSLSRVYGLIDRFSEDVDILLVFPQAAGSGSRNSAMKRMVERARIHLGFPAEACTLAESTTGVKRNVKFEYPREFKHTAAREYLLLEMGSRGGPDPHERHKMRSMVADYAIDMLGEQADEWEEFAPISVEVLAAERTLIEKCALLHNLGARYTEDSGAERDLARAGRHYYDIHQLLGNVEVRAALAELGQSGLQNLVNDVNARSEAAGWAYVERPRDGYGASPAFDPNAAGRDVAERSFNVAMGMVYAAAPSYEECLATVRQHRSLI